MVGRADLEHAIRAACTIVEQPGCIIIGSQSILGTWDETRLPEAATFSDELDIIPLGDDDAESLAAVLDGAIGEFSEFHRQHGFYIQGVGLRTAYLADDWTDRLVLVSTPATNGFTGYCLDPHDLCAAKLIANREKDRAFVTSLVEARLVDPEVVHERVWWTDAPSENIDAASTFLAPLREHWRVAGIVREPS